MVVVRATAATRQWCTTPSGIRCTVKGALQVVSRCVATPSQPLRRCGGKACNIVAAQGGSVGGDGFFLSGGPSHFARHCTSDLHKILKAAASSNCKLSKQSFRNQQLQEKYSASAATERRELASTAASEGNSFPPTKPNRNHVQQLERAKQNFQG